MKNISARFLIVTAFTSGMTIMAIEMAASRLMAPYFGTSVFIWTNLLGVIMLALSLGYWLGGKWADRHPTREYLYTLILIASCMLLLLPLIAPWIMSFVSKGVSEGEVSLIINSFLSSLVIFCIPFLVLGMISPTIIRLLSKEVDHSGRVAGQVYAASTVGSIIGTFLPTLLFVPWLGTKKTIIVFAICLLVISLFGLGKRLFWFLILVFTSVLVFVPREYSFGDDIVYQTETPYTFLRIAEDEAYGYILQQDEAYAMHSFYHPDKVLTGSYWDYLLPAPYFQPSKKQQMVAAIGSAGGTAFRVLEETTGDDFDFRFFGAELDPKVVELAYQYFGMDQYPNVEMQDIDGRIFLQGSSDSYDIIMLDAYHQIYVPPHLTSLEFFQLTRDHLTANGVMVANINSLFEDSAVLQRIIRTIQEIYSKVWVMKAGEDNYNYLIYATNGTGELERAINYVSGEYALEKYLFSSNTKKVVEKDQNYSIITDDRPLAEILVDKMIGEWLLRQ